MFHTSQRPADRTTATGFDLRLAATPELPRSLNFKLEAPFGLAVWLHDAGHDAVAAIAYASAPLPACRLERTGSRYAIWIGAHTSFEVSQDEATLLRLTYPTLRFDSAEVIYLAGDVEEVCA